jgi:hypothetical protein
MDKKIKDRIITGSIIFIGGYLLYKIFKKPEIKTPSNQEIEATIGGQVGVSTTFDSAKYKEIADKMFDAMTGWGTNLNVLYNNFALMKTNDDVMALIAAYGIREIPSGKFNPVPDFGGNLPEAIANELTQGEIDNINTILSKNTVTIRFNDNGQLTTL